MLIRITHQCSMGCSHCMVDALPNTGLHMTEQTFDQVLRFAKTMEMVLPNLILSGGEPTEHPACAEFAQKASAAGFMVTILSNGTFLRDQELTKKLQFPASSRIKLYVTNDARYYPERVPIPTPDMGIFYADNIGDSLAPYGRAKHRSDCVKKFPMCFNIQSATHATKDIRSGYALLQARMRLCCPSINYDGSIVAGETPSCMQVGTVWDTTDHITTNLLQMRCNACGLERNYGPQHLAAIQRSR